MNSFRLLFTMNFCVLTFGCHSSQPMKQSASDNEIHIPKQTIIKANGSFVTAIVNNITIIDSIYFTVSLHIISSQQQGQYESFAESGQDITVSPQFVLDEKNSIDAANQRNKRLISLRNAKSGTSISGNISLSSGGKWVIVDVETK